MTGPMCLMALTACLAACQPVRLAATLTQGQATIQSSAPSAKASEKAPVILLPVTHTIPTTRVSLGESIWLETARTPETANLQACSDALSILGQLSCAGATIADRLPKQPVVSWQQRVGDHPHRVIVEAEVVLRSGYLEHLLSRAEAGKDHESILSAPFDAERLYLGLMATGLRAGKPATFVNEKREYSFKPATGDPVRIYCQYLDEKGNMATVPAQNWVVRGKEDKLLDADWIFAGSYRGVSKSFEGDEKEYFGANDGRVICLTNFGSALLDLPFESVDSDPQGNDLGFRANTAAIPELRTKVRVILQPAAPVKK